MRNKKRRSWKKKGPPAKPMVPLPNLGAKALGQLPVKSSNSLAPEKRSEEEVLKGNLKSRFKNSFVEFLISVMKEIRPHLMVLMVALIISGSHFLLERFVTSRILILGTGFVMGVSWTWLILGIIQKITGVRIRDWLIMKLNSLLE